MARVPVVVVLGATGAGKSKLALEIAQRFGGEIISADAMQMYKGLDIVTNKVTQEERRLVKHHMIDYLDPLLRTTVVEFRNKAGLIIDDLKKRNVMPVICGGTNYYIESLLWQVLVETSSNTTESACKRFKTTGIDDESMTNAELYNRLKEQDPERASQLHPQERRKVVRSLQVLEREGRKHSDILADQMASSGGSLLGGGLRYPRDQLTVLWVRCKQTTLDERCDKRVEQMLSDGLLAELQAFHQDFNQRRGDTSANDYTIGIFQSIGFKEFHDYLLLDSDQQESAQGQKLFRQGKDQMMTATRRYARKQTKWIKQRFMRTDRQCPPVYAVDSTDPGLWEAAVQTPAFKVVQAYLDGDLASISHLALTVDPANAYSFQDTRQMLTCDVCHVSLKGKLQFEAHVKGRKHHQQLRHSKMRLLMSLQGVNDLESCKMQLESVLRELIVKEPSTNIVLESPKADQIMLVLPAKESGSLKEDIKASCKWIRDVQVDYFLSEKPKNDTPL